MRVTHLGLRNFLAYKRLDLDLTGSHQLAITGEVGAGKSTLLDALLWALYGKGRGSADQMIRHGATESSAYVEALVRGEVMTVRRTRRLNKTTSLTLEYGGKQTTKHTVAETEAEIERLLGMSYEALLAGPFMVQGKSDELMRVGPADRKDLLGRLFGLSEYERYHETAKQHLSDLRLEASAKQAILTELDSRVAQRFVIEGEIRHLEPVIDDIDDSLKASEQMVIDLRAEATSLMERERQLTGAKALVTSIGNEITSLDQVRAERQKSNKRLMAQATVIDTVPCGGEGIYATCPLLQMAFKARDELGDKGNLDDLDEQMLELAPRLKDARKEVLRLSEDALRIDSVKQLLAEADSTWIEVRTRRETVMQQWSRLQADLEQVTEAAERRHQVASEYDQIMAQVQVYEVLADAFHRNGLPAIILERGLPLIEAASNDVLSRMPGGLQIRLATQRETKAKTIKETLDVVVISGTNERDYVLLSGGQRFRVDFALRLGISHVLVQRSGAPVDTLWLDEGWGTQDAEGREAMLEAISHVSDRFGRIIVVSHYPEVTDRFPARLEVRMRDDTSVAELVA